ncbi:MAG: Ig-like domain-containing protein, partial [Cyanobacteria bacterium J06576_12]
MDTRGQLNAPAAANDDGSTPEDQVLTANVLANDTDADGDTLSVSAINGQTADVGQEITLDSGALLTVNADGSYSYDPNGQFDALNEGETGSDSFTYTTTDGNQTSEGVFNEATGTATITITGAGALNTAPVADDDSYSTAFDTPLTVNANNGVLDGDTDADGDDLTVAIDSDPGNGSVSLNANGAFTYTPDAGFTGDDSFTYTVDDGNGGTDSATVTVTVAEEVIVNNAPVADDDSYTTAFDTPLTVNAGNGVLDGDTDADGDN